MKLFGRRVIELPPSTTATSPTGDWTKFTQEILDFDQVFNYSNKLKDCDALFYALGANPNKTDMETFKKVTAHILTIGKMAKDVGIKHFHWTSGFLVSKTSWIAASRVVAEMEEPMKALELPRLSIYKPGAILTDDNDGGMSGKGGVAVLRFLDKGKWLSVEANLLGKFQVQNSFTESKVGEGKVEVFTNKEINVWGKQQKK